MKVGLYARYAAMPNPTGIGESSLRLIGALNGSFPEFEYSVYCDATPSPDLMSAARKAVHVRSFWSPRWRESVGREVLLPLLTRWDRIDLLHSLSGHVPRIPAGRIVATINDLSVFKLPGLKPEREERYWRSVLARGIARADRLIAISEATKRDIVEVFGRDPGDIDVVYLGVDHEVYCPLPAREPLARIRDLYGLAPAAPYFLCVGTLEPRKNIATVIEAMTCVHRQDACLLVVGRDGPSSESLRDMARRPGLRERVRFLGYLPREHLPLLYSEALAVLFPSRYEGFGLPAAEAMACGAPVVASDAPGLAEVVGGWGVLLDPGQVEAWSQTCSRLLDDHAYRAALAERGRERASIFRWEETARKTVDVYRRVCNGA